MLKPIYGNQKNVWFIERGEVLCYEIKDLKKVNGKVFKNSGFYGVILASITGFFALNAVVAKIPVLLLLMLIIISTILLIRITAILIFKIAFETLVKVETRPVPFEVNETRKKMVILLSICILITTIAMLVFLFFKNIRFDSGLIFTLCLYITGVIYDTYDFKKYNIN